MRKLNKFEAYMLFIHFYYIDYGIRKFPYVQTAFNKK
jgi:hypothetical protein